MNIVIHSASNVVSLLAINFILGLMSSCLCFFSEDIIVFICLLPRKRFISFTEYFSFEIQSRQLVILGDLLLCIISASLLLVAAFILNSGLFRLIAIPIYLFGFLCGKYFVGPIVENPFKGMLFLFKRIIDVLTLPLMWLISIVWKIIARLVERCLRIFIKKFLKRYTERYFSHIKDDTEFGLLNNYYKELKNERTV